MSGFVAPIVELLPIQIPLSYLYDFLPTDLVEGVNLDINTWGFQRCVETPTLIGSNYSDQGPTEANFYPNCVCSGGDFSSDGHGYYSLGVGFLKSLISVQIAADGHRSSYSLDAAFPVLSTQYRYNHKDLSMLTDFGLDYFLNINYVLSQYSRGIAQYTFYKIPGAGAFNAAYPNLIGGPSNSGTSTGLGPTCCFYSSSLANQKSGAGLVLFGQADENGGASSDVQAQLFYDGSFNFYNQIDGVPTWPVNGVPGVGVISFSAIGPHDYNYVSAYFDGQHYGYGVLNTSFENDLSDNLVYQLKYVIIPEFTGPRALQRVPGGFMTADTTDGVFIFNYDLTVYRKLTYVPLDATAAYVMANRPLIYSIDQNGFPIAVSVGDNSPTLPNYAFVVLGTLSLTAFFTFPLLQPPGPPIALPCINIC